ncbi:MAG: hypothetical protein ACX930_11875 [Erythrobacter sp.]
MDRTRTFKLALLAGAAVALQGCVAAIGPIAAASGVLGSSATRGSDDDSLAAAPQPAAAPTIEPIVIVERSDQRREESPSLVAESAEPMDESAQETLATTALDSPREELAGPLPVDDTGESSAIATIGQADPVTVGRMEQSTAFLTAFPIGGDEPSASMREPASRPTATELALAAPPASQPEPASDPGPAPVVDTPVRIIAVDPQVALADSSSASASVSAAEAAAALTAIKADAEPEPSPVALARAPQPAARDPEPQPSSTSVAATELTRERTTAARLAMSPSATAPVPPPPAPRPLATGAFASLINYANRQQARSAESRASAVLADRASLMPTRAPCGDAEPTVLIDLDPDGATFDPTNVPRAAPGLSGALAQMRAWGVKIAWISGNAQGQFGAIREALNRSGLDLDNSDQLLLMRYPEDRKQTRREDLAASSCLIAIAGDQRTDFDELFEYLLNPEAAAALDPLIENGWFLIPQPLNTERPDE